MATFNGILGAVRNFLSTAAAHTTDCEETPLLDQQQRTAELASPIIEDSNRAVAQHVSASAAEAGKEPIAVDRVPFPGPRAQFERTGGSWEYYDSGGEICLHLIFTTPTKGALFREFDFLGYLDGSILIRVETNALGIVCDYFKRLSIVVRDPEWFLSPQRLEDTRTLFSVIALHNDIPAGDYQRMKKIVDQGYCEPGNIPRNYAARDLNYELLGS